MRQAVGAFRSVATLASILSYAGRDIRVWQNGAWTDVPGWGMAEFAPGEQRGNHDSAAPYGHRARQQPARIRSS